MEELIISTGYPRFWMEQLSPQVSHLGSFNSLSPWTCFGGSYGTATLMPPRCRFRLTPISFLVGMIATLRFHSFHLVLSGMGTYTFTAIAASVSLPIFARKK